MFDPPCKAVSGSLYVTMRNFLFSHRMAFKVSDHTTHTTHATKKASPRPNDGDALDNAGLVECETHPLVIFRAKQ